MCGHCSGKHETKAHGAKSEAMKKAGKGRPTPNFTRHRVGDEVRSKKM